MEIHVKNSIFVEDVATALGYSNTRDALSKHVDAEDKTTVATRDTGSCWGEYSILFCYHQFWLNEKILLPLH